MTRTLTTEEHIAECLTPTGKKLVTDVYPVNPALYIVKYKEGPGTLPQSLTGLYTSRKRADDAITKTLMVMWEDAASKMSPSMAKRVAEAAVSTATATA